VIVGCYVLDLYCDNDDCPSAEGRHRGGKNEPDQFTGPSKRYCYRDAKKAGWKISDKRDAAYCPDCKGKAR